MPQIKNENECTGVCATCGKCTVDFSADIISEDMDMIRVRVFGADVLAARLFENAETAVSSMGPTVCAERISDIEKISDIGFVKLPALAVNGKVLSQGKVISAAEISSLIMKLI